MLRLIFRKKSVMGLLILLFIALLIPQYTSAQDNVVYQGENNGAVSFVVSVYSVKKKYAVAYGERLAVEHLLFRGLPGSKEYSRPLCGTTNEEKMLSEHKDYFDRMLSDNGRFLSFITYGEGEYDRLAKCTIVNVVVNAKALTQDLRTWKIVRFGFHK